MAAPARLQAFLRTSAGTGREVVESEPFTAYLDRHDALKFLNYAVPSDGARPDVGDVERLRGVFRSRGRLPRLEWLEEASPDVASALLEAGMLQELRAPLMTCTPGQLADVQAGIDGVGVAGVSDGDLRELADVQRVAFGMAALGEHEEPSDPRRHGGGAVLARVEGEPVSAAQWTPVVDGISEIGGVATAEAWRGRRLAGVVTAAAARAAIAGGASLLVLSPGDEAAERVYARAGFTPAATILHWSDPE